MKRRQRCGSSIKAVLRPHLASISSYYLRFSQVRARTAGERMDEGSSQGDRGESIYRGGAVIELALAKNHVAEYVDSDDAHYACELKRSGEGRPGLCDLELTSQSWQGITWIHRVRVLIPKGASRPYVVLMVTGSGDGREELALCGEISRLTGMAVAILHDVPNQPLFGNLHEDALMAYTFAKYLEGGAWDWPLLLPMTKSVVKAMDAVELLYEKITGTAASGFIVTGASKRGWTSWLSAIVDRRIKGIAPMVYDNLNLHVQMRHQRECYGGYSEQISDYTDLGLVEELETEGGRRLVEIIDPYAHRDELVIPKLIINGTNDRYWTIDSLNLYFNDLLGEKHVLYVPNSGHGLEDRRRVVNTLSAFALSVSKATTLPRMRVEYPTNSEADIELDVEPRCIDAWRTTSSNMDFRDSRWTSEPIGGIGKYRHETRAGNALMACFIESSFDTSGFPFSLSSQMHVTVP